MSNIESPTIEVNVGNIHVGLPGPYFTISYYVTTHHLDHSLLSKIELILIVKIYVWENSLEW